MGPELSQILWSRPGAETAKEVGSQIVKFRTFDSEGDTRSQMLKTTDGCGETRYRQNRFRCLFAHRRQPLAGKMMKDRDMCLQKVAGRGKVFLPQAVKRLDVIGLDMSGYDDWR